MMNVVDLMNLVTLERKGISVLSEHIDAPPTPKLAGRPSRMPKL